MSSIETRKKLRSELLSGKSVVCLVPEGQLSVKQQFVWALSQRAVEPNAAADELSAARLLN